MGCPITFKSISRDCKAIGGIKRLIIFDRNDISSVQVALSADGNTLIDDIMLVATKTGQEFQLVTATSSMNTTANISKDNGTIFYQTEVVPVFYKLTSDKRTILSALAVGELVVIVEDNNGKYWYLGFDNPVEITALTAGTGTALGDKNGYDVTFTDWSKVMPYEVDTTSVVISDLLPYA